MEKLSPAELEDLFIRWLDLGQTILDIYSDLSALEPYKNIPNIGYQEKLYILNNLIKEEDDILETLCANKSNVLSIIATLYRNTGLGLNEFGEDLELTLDNDDEFLIYRRMYNKISFFVTSIEFLNKKKNAKRFLKDLGLSLKTVAFNALYLDYINAFLTLSSSSKVYLETEYKNIVTNTEYFSIYLYPALEKRYISNNFTMPISIDLTGGVISDIVGLSERQLEDLKVTLVDEIDDDLDLFMDDGILNKFNRQILQRTLLLFKRDEDIEIEEQFAREHLQALEQHKEDKKLVRNIRLVK